MMEEVYVCSICDKIFRDNRKHFANRRCGFSGMKMEKYLMFPAPIDAPVGDPNLNFGGDFFPDLEGEWR